MGRFDIKGGSGVGSTGFGYNFLGYLAYFYNGFIVLFSLSFTNGFLIGFDEFYSFRDFSTFLPCV